jgi:predicted DNA-binding mobile mystery protein A
MSLEAMAQRMGVTRQSAHQLEAAEVAGSITLRRLRAAADALECDVYLRLIPRTSLEQTVRTQAERKARANLLRIQQTMAMEAQALSPEVLEAMIQQEAQNLIAKGGSSLWD